MEALHNVVRALIDAISPEDWEFRLRMMPSNMDCTWGRSGMIFIKKALKSSAEKKGIIFTMEMTSINSGIKAIRIYSVA